MKDKVEEAKAEVPAFTPAPWTYYTGKLRPQFSTIVHEIQDANGTAIVAWSGFDGVDFSQDEIAANAHLIAAAPALYVALKNITEQMRQFSDDEYIDGCEPLIDAADDALALAEGKQVK